MTKTEKDIKLLDESIEHHRRMLRYSKRSDFTEPEDKPYADHCALCEHYLKTFDINDCGDCPIAVLVRAPGCKGTPWDPLRDAWVGICALSLYGVIDRFLKFRGRLKIFHMAEQAEIDFLVGIRNKLKENAHD